MRNTFILAFLMLTACEEHPTGLPAPPVVVSVPVTIPCLSGERPALIEALKGEYSVDQWNALSVRQKSALVVAKGLERQSYGDGVTAATAGCQ